jgi:hypothetical protein
MLAAQGCRNRIDELACLVGTLPCLGVPLVIGGPARANHRPIAGDSAAAEAIKVLARGHQNLI